MFRNYKNYKIYFRKDGRYVARVMDQGHSTVFYGRTKKEVQQKLEVYIAGLNATAQIKYEMSHPTKCMPLTNWAYAPPSFLIQKSTQNNIFSDFDDVFLKLNQEFSYLINIEVHHKMNLWNDTAMSRTLQTDECA